jgi:hypothetical protein
MLALIIAQSLGEYGGAAGGGIGGALSDAWFRLRVTLADHGGAGTWLVGAGALVVVWLFFRGRR